MGRHKGPPGLDEVLGCLGPERGGPARPGFRQPQPGLPGRGVWPWGVACCGRGRRGRGFCRGGVVGAGRRRRRQEIGAGPRGRATSSASRSPPSDPRASPWTPQSRVTGSGVRASGEACHGRPFLTSYIEEPRLSLSVPRAGSPSLNGKDAGIPHCGDPQSGGSAGRRPWSPPYPASEPSPRTPGGRGPGRGSARFCF